MLSIPLQAVPSQTIAVQLGGQQCQINIYQRAYGIFLDLSTIGGVVSPNTIVNGQLCENLIPIIRYLYLGFIGDFIFADTQGTSNPVYPMLGTRFLLLYLNPSEVLQAAANIAVMPVFTPLILPAPAIPFVPAAPATGFPELIVNFDMRVGIILWS